MNADLIKPGSYRSEGYIYAWNVCHMFESWLTTAVDRHTQVTLTIKSIRALLFRIQNKSMKSNYQLEQKAKNRFFEKVFQEHPRSHRRCTCSSESDCQAVAVCSSCIWLLKTTDFNPKDKTCTQQSVICKHYDQDDGGCPRRPRRICVLCEQFFCIYHLRFMCMKSLWILIRKLYIHD